ncbi:MAG: glutaredoxin family protein [Anaerolineae bacterium]|nr:glutaredoxin family protein [Anaerolineae bacterium]
MHTELVMYSRTYGCPYITTAKRILQQEDVPYREVFIDKDSEARARVLKWTGFLSVPTLIVAHQGDILPLDEPAPLPQGTSPRGIDRGAMITEPSAEELRDWLQKYDFIR